jgi:hypothetical protein
MTLRFTIRVFHGDSNKRQLGPCRYHTGLNIQLRGYTNRKRSASVVRIRSQAIAPHLKLSSASGAAFTDSNPYDCSVPV